MLENSQPNQINPTALHFMRLIEQGRDTQGLTKVSKLLFPYVKKEIPADLVEFLNKDDQDFVSLTLKGVNALEAIERLKQ